MYQNVYVQRKENNRTLIHIWDDETGYSVQPYVSYAYIKDPDGKFQTIYGDNVTRINTWSLWDVNNNRIFESDVSPSMRVIVDKYYKSDEPAKGHRITCIDIEVDVTDGLPDLDKADNEITAISLYDQISDKYYVWILDTDDRVNSTGYDNVSILSYNTERNLLQSFIDKWDEICPTIVTGWNIDGFDIPYIYKRLSQILGSHESNRLSPIGEVFYNEYRKRYFIAGISCLDYIELYKKFTFTQLHSYALDVVARHELGRGKVEFSGSLSDLFRDDIKKFITYNLVDVQLVIDLDKKMNLIELVMGICHKGHVPLEDVYFPSRWVEGTILTYTKRQNLVVPNKGTYEKNDDDKFIGAYVKTPQIGKHQWLYDLDFKSLYPNLIITLNVSPETKVGRVKDWNATGDVSMQMDNIEVTILGQTTCIPREDFCKLMNDNNFCIAANGIIYRQDVKGFIPKILEEWNEDKEKYNRLMKEFGNKGDMQRSKYYKHRRTISKTMLNTVYGVMGLPRFRFCDIDNVIAITTSGVLLIKYAEQMTNYYYNKITNENKDYCIYIDTDSEFYSAIPLIEKLYPETDTSNDKLMNDITSLICLQVQTFLNDSFDMFASKFLHCKKHTFVIKQEVIAKTGMWVGKKRYALHITNDNGVPTDEIDVKGLDIKRSDFPLAFRQFMKDLLWNDFLKDTEKFEVDAKILHFKEFMKTLPIEEIATPTGVKGIVKYSAKGNMQKFGNWIKGTPAHVKAAISYNELVKYLKLDKTHALLRDGEKIRWVYLKTNSYGLNTIALRGDRDPAEILNFIKMYIDYNSIFERVLMSKIEDFYTALDWSFPSPCQNIINDFFI